MALPKRIVKEIEQLSLETYAHNRGYNDELIPTLASRSIAGISAVPRQDNLRHFDVEIHGPTDSPYAGSSTCRCYLPT
jgi:ubiquitin-conjugating enzyme E2 N